MENNITKEIVYTLPYKTKLDIKIAGDIRERLYEEYDDVITYPNGLYELIIKAS